MNMQAPMMQGMMSNYIEQSKNLFVQMQEQMQNGQEHVRRLPLQPAAAGQSKPWRHAPSGGCRRTVSRRHGRESRGSAPRAEPGLPASFLLDAAALQNGGHEHQATESAEQQAASIAPGDQEQRSQ